MDFVEGSAARQVPLNVPFGLPGGAANLYELGSEGTLWWTRYDDRVRHRGTSSLLDRCMATRTCPKIVETFGAAELWGLRMSPDLIGTDARADLALPETVRRYYFPSVSHGGSFSGGFPVTGDKPFPRAPECSLAWNPNPSSDTRRALLKALANWVSVGIPPPASRYPTLASGDLVEPTPAAMGWPAIPNVPSPAGMLNAFVDYDFGAGFNYRDLSGVVTRQPPNLQQTMPSRVARVSSPSARGRPSVGLGDLQWCGFVLAPASSQEWAMRPEDTGHVDCPAKCVGAQVHPEGCEPFRTVVGRKIRSASFSLAIGRIDGCLHNPHSSRTKNL